MCSDDAFVPNATDVCVFPAPAYWLRGGCELQLGGSTKTAPIGCVVDRGVVADEATCFTLGQGFVAENSSNQLWYRPAHTASECISVGGCVKLPNYHYTRRANFPGPHRNQSDCHCGEIWQPYWTWSGGRWLNATARPLSWQAAAFQPRWAPSSTAFRYTDLAQKIQSISLGLWTEQAKTFQKCRFNLVRPAIEAVLCGSSASADAFFFPSLLILTCCQILPALIIFLAQSRSALESLVLVPPSRCRYVAVVHFFDKSIR